MSTTTITTKGQVTIPKKVRDSLQLHTGDIIEIVITKEGEAVLRPVTKKVDDLYGILYKKDRKPVSLEGMDEAIRNKIRERNK